MKQIVYCVMAIAVITLLLQSCSKEQKTQTAKTTEQTVTVASNGSEVTFAPNAPQLNQFKVNTVEESSLALTLSAPVHNLVTVIPSETSSKKLDLFETQDLTDTYSNYITAMASLQHSSLALQRQRDLYAHDIASAKDVQDAEQDYATQQAAVADNEAKLRAAGIDPKALAAAPAGTVWAIADLSEEQVRDVRPGMRVEIQYITYPGEKFTGEIASVGQAIDPATRKVKVRVVLANVQERLHTAMFGTAQFIGTSQRAIVVPSTAVVREGDGTMSAWITDNGLHFVRHAVSIGAQQDSIYAIVGGLTPGDQVVTSGGVFLSNMNESIDLPDREEKK